SICFYRQQPPSSSYATLNQVIRGIRKPKIKFSKSPALEGNLQKKGVCNKVFTTKPKKPNSAVRKVARVKLSTGKFVTAYIPGEGHNLVRKVVLFKQFDETNLFIFKKTYTRVNIVLFLFEAAALKIYLV